MGGNVDNLIELVENPVTGVLTADGVQWSTEVDTTTADVDVVGFGATVQNPFADDLDWNLLKLEFGLRVAVRAVSSATADPIWKWQIRNKGGTWVDLHAAVTETDVGAADVERSRTGYFNPQTNIDKLPFDVQLLLQCNEANEGRIKVKSSTYFKYLARRPL